MDQSVLLPFRLAVIERNLGVTGIHVHQRGHEPVAHHTRVDVRRDVHSVSKTFTAVAIGIARDQGALDLDDTVLSHLPELAGGAAEGAAAITLRHLLTMTSGIGYRWDPDFADDGSDPAQEFLASPVLDPPGKAFRYRGLNSYLLGRVIHRRFGQDLREFLLARLFRPLGIMNPQWHRCPLGFPLGADGLFLRTEEIARLGETLLEDGVYRGQRIVSGEYVREMMTAVVETTAHSTDPESAGGYGLQIWPCTRPDTWRMDGLYGQLCIIAPDLGACITLTSHNEAGGGDILRQVWSQLLPALPPG